MDIEELLNILKEYSKRLPIGYEKQRIGHYIKALNFVLGKYNKNSEILKIVSMYK